VDRIKDMIITGGGNVYPREVEEVLYTRQEVQECSVIGLPDREWGERVTAVIVPKPAEKIDQKNLKDFLREHLSPFKVPKEYRIVKEPPKNPAGKILKRELREKLLEQSCFCRKAYEGRRRRLNPHPASRHRIMRPVHGPRCTAHGKSPRMQQSACLHTVRPAPYALYRLHAGDQESS